MFADREISDCRLFLSAVRKYSIFTGENVGKNLIFSLKERTQDEDIDL